MKKVLSILLSVLLLISVVGSVSLSVSAASLPDHLIINQVYGRKATKDAPITHSFIELYNPTNQSVNLSGYSVQYAESGSNWSRKNLTGTLPARTSYLVRCSTGTDAEPRVSIIQYDMDWPEQIINNGTYKVALVNHQNTLTLTAPTAAQGIVDLVGVSGADHSEGSPVLGNISKNIAVRRIQFSDINNNSLDFETLDYRTPQQNAAGISDERLATVRPRSMADGVWGLGITPPDITPPEQTPADHLIIYQAYGRDNKTESAISHSFFEIYNPTKQAINLTGYSIQYALSGTNWVKKDFPAGTVLPAQHSFLIRCYSEAVEEASVRYAITDSKADLNWLDLVVSNSGFKVALVNHQNLLTVSNPSGAQGTIDFVGVGGTDAYEGMGTTVGISKQKAVRRSMAVDTDNNRLDFKDYSYRDISFAEILHVRPRSLADGAWEDSEFTEPGNPLVFSAPAGLYLAPFNLTLSSEYAGAVIRYTLDGSDPTSTSPVYTAPISIRDRTTDSEVLAKIKNIVGSRSHVGNTYTPPANGTVFKGTVVKARVFTTDGQPLSDMVINSYFVNNNMMTKYKMPVISITTPQENFFDNTLGLYVNNNWINTGAEWERPIYFEMFEADGTPVISQGMGVRMHGGWSRDNPQKTFRFYARSGALDNGQVVPNGKSTVAYDLFNGTAKDINGNAITTYKRFIIRNGANDAGGAFLRDEVVQVSAFDLRFDTMAYRPVVAFVNGEFWGLFNMRERYDDEYLVSTYGGNKADYCVLEKGADSGTVQISEGVQEDVDYYYQTVDYFKNTDFSIEANYQRAKELIDEDSLIDYVITETFYTNGDWPHNNQRFWRYKGTPNDNPGQNGRWHWMLYDIDYGFTGGTTNDSISRIRNHNDLIFFGRLLNNPTFKTKFVNRYTDLVNTYFSSAVVNKLINDMSAAIAGTIPEQINRWNAIKSYSGWEGSVNAMKSFANGRPNGALNVVSSVLMQGAARTTLTLNNNSADGHLVLNDIAIIPSTPGVTNALSWSGSYFVNTTQTITAVPDEGYTLEKIVVQNLSTNQTAEYTDETISVTIAAAGNKVTAYYVEEAPPGVKTELQQLVDSSVTIKSDRYTEDSFLALQQALAAANDVLADEKATQLQIDQALQVLQQAIDTLQLRSSSSLSFNAPSSVVRNEEFDIVITSDQYINYLILRNENDMKVGANVISKTKTEDGKCLTTLRLSVGTVGEGRTLHIFSGLTWLGFVTFDVVTPPTGIQQVQAPDTAGVNETFLVTVTASKELIKAKFINEKGGTIGSKRVSRVVTGDVAVSVYELAVGTAGARTVTFLADFDKKSDWPFSLSFDIAITK